MSALNNNAWPSEFYTFNRQHYQVFRKNQTKDEEYIDQNIDRYTSSNKRNNVRHSLKRDTTRKKMPRPIYGIYRYNIFS